MHNQFKYKREWPPIFIYQIQTIEKNDILCLVDTLENVPEMYLEAKWCNLQSQILYLKNTPVDCISLCYSSNA